MKLIYAKSLYIADESLAIASYVEDEGYLEPYGDVSVCLVDYGMEPEPGHIFMPTYKMPKEFVDTVIRDIVDTVVREVQIGYGKGLYVKLKDNWEKSVTMMDWN